ncbi:hypothetical protein A4A36_09525 [Bacillus subtilis]|nr:hypothetical protein A4A35_07515 [Bacillus subtilis]OIS70233.1 hypothetical protein A4A37_06715 [Bacillus subtilis]OIS71576.1 hypothetical protein A4A36_09525 [Bacillus subtilis]
MKKHKKTKSVYHLIYTLVFYRKCGVKLFRRDVSGLQELYSSAVTSHFLFKIKQAFIPAIF